MLVCYTHVPRQTHQHVAFCRNRRPYGDESFKAAGTAQEQEEQAEKEVAEVRPLGCVEAVFASSLRGRGNQKSCAGLQVAWARVAGGH